MSAYTSVPIFLPDAITVRVHTATVAGNVGRDVNLQDFAGGRAMRLLRENQSGELLAEAVDLRTKQAIEFIQGAEL